MRDSERAYIYKLNVSGNSDQYSFIGVDSSVNPGPRAPFNFFGLLTKVNWCRSLQTLIISINGQKFFF